MRVPIDWLGDYVALPDGVRGAQIATDLVRVGLEEEGLHGGEVRGPLVVGRVLDLVAEPQKNGRTINWCHVDVGDHGQRLSDGVPQGIVCGAHNFAAGDLVAVILPGGVLPGPSGPITVSERKTYGHLSAGMICSARELGLGEDHEGIIVLTDLLGEAADDLQPGQDLIPILGLDREVVEVNVTPDRGYCFSLRGIAREYSHSTGTTFTDPADLPVTPATTEGYVVQLADDAPLEGVAGCDRYVARIVRGLDLSRHTPRWMATRLTEAGMRPISLAVDVTNYVMLALGQPLHAFDLPRLGGPILVRRARAGEALRTLDDVTRTLDPEDLLICAGGTSAADTTDRGDTILALAGVMGGESSEVSAVTADVLIESAHFDARTVARTARRHKLSTEASKRFERGVDPDVTAAAAQLAVDLLVELGGGSADSEVTDADHRPRRESFRMPLDLPQRYTGVAYPALRIREILIEIGCELDSVDADAEAADVVRVLPPSWRPDLTDGPSLVEEVARIDGYDRIASTVPAAPGGRGLTAGQRARRLVSATLAAQGLVEVVTSPFVGPDRLDDLGLAAQDPRRTAVRLANPMSDVAPLMRTELLQTLPETLRRNVARGRRDVALFEIDTVTRPRPGRGAPVPGVGARPDDATLQAIRGAVPDQPWHLAVLAAGETDRSGWWGRGRAADAGDAVAWAQAVCEALGVSVERLMTERAPWHPGRCAELMLTDGSTVGWAGELHPQVVQRLGLPERTVAAELDLDVLVAAGSDITQARPISTHPVATSDIALTVSRSVRHGDVAESVRAGAGDLLESVLLFDVYRGDQIGADEQSLAFRLTFRAPDRTLRTQEVNAARDAAVARAARDHGAIQR